MSHHRTLIPSRRQWHAGRLAAGLTAEPAAGRSREACEGGCGVIGVIASEPLAGRHLLRPLGQMCNRGNGKGGGIAAAGCFADYPHHFALHVALLDSQARREVERDWVEPRFHIAEAEELPHISDHRDLPRLALRPPEVVRYFVRARPDVLAAFAEQAGLCADPAAAEAELVYRNSCELNDALYVAPAEPRAFVLSHGRDLMILKGVGFAEDILQYYELSDFEALAWIGHQRYPTRGRVWHPGGAHPFAGLDEALVHNGDLANYHAIVEYLSQKGIAPRFATDTEAAALLFDLYSRGYGYPLEHVCEALAPTTERDFDLLPKDRQRIYRALRASHLHGSPDGPFFFIVARTEPAAQRVQLIGITDTSMLRPQVFALHQGRPAIGLIASEKQAIDSYLEHLAASDGRVLPLADAYWNARGGSYTHGGAYAFTVDCSAPSGERTLSCADKFGRAIRPAGPTAQPRGPLTIPKNGGAASADVDWATVLDAAGPRRAFEQAAKRVAAWSFDELTRALGTVVDFARCGSEQAEQALELLTLLLDQRYGTGQKKLSAVRALTGAAIDALLDELGAGEAAAPLRRVGVDHSPAELEHPAVGGGLLAIDATGFEPQGPSSVSRLLCEAYRRGWRRLLVYRSRGDRFLGCGLGPGSDGLRLDVYGSSGDYLGSGLDGAEIQVHGDAQDQVGQILKSGRLVIHGSAGQTMLYGAKGGEVFVRGNTAGRPLINAVGNVRVIVNGTCLDYAAESFMAGPHTGGGFLLINGVFNLPDGRVYGLEVKYPGTNLFSLSSGGCCYLNDPYRTVSESQLNGARFDPFLQEDWNVLEPYQRLNEQLFRIHTRYDLLTVDGVLRWPKEVYRKIVPASSPRPVE